MAWLSLPAGGDTFLSGVTELPPETTLAKSPVRETVSKGCSCWVCRAGLAIGQTLAKTKQGNVTGLWKEEERISEKRKSSPPQPRAEQSCPGSRTEAQLGLLVSRALS